MMSRNKALIIYLLGALGQIIIVCLLVLILRTCGIVVSYSTPIGWIAIALGGCSSALWGIIISIKYYKISLKVILGDFFRIKQSPMNYVLMIVFFCLDFLPILFGGRIEISTWYIPIILFCKHIIFGGVEEIGWRYLFQPLLQEKLHYVFATLLTFIAWGIWHFLFFYIDGTNVDVTGFLVGLLTNCFILSALYFTTNNLWLCVMTHSLINVCSQLFIGGNQYVLYASKVIIIVLSIILVYKINKQKNKAEESRS